MANTTTITGYLGAHPEHGQSEATRTPWARFRVAVNEQWKDREGNKQRRTTWINVYTFNGLAKTVRHLAKGDRVLIQGALRNDAYRIGEKEIQTLELEAQKIEFLRVASFESAN